MIVADSFVKSDKARAAEFSTCETDRPLVVQFAANCATTLARAAEYVVALVPHLLQFCSTPNISNVGMLMRSTSIVAVRRLGRSNKA